MYTPLPAALAGETQTRPITIDRSLFFLVTGALVYLTEQEPLEPTGTLTVDAAKAALSAMLDVYLEGEIVAGQFQVDGCDLQVSYDNGETWETLIDLSTCATPGPKGDTGDTGATGATGAAGPKIIGTIIPYATTSAPSGCLPCDGTIYLKADYPALVAVLNSVYFTDSTHFKTPDLRDRAMIGTGGNNGNGSAIGAGLTARSQGDAVGAETHTLTTAELPSHAHTYTMRLFNITSPTVNAVSPAGSTTGAQTDATGSGNAHNNMPPSHAVGFCIVAST